MKRTADISIFLEGTTNTGMVFYGVDLVQMWESLDVCPKESSFLCLEDEDGNDVAINITKIEFIRIKQKV